MPQNNKPTEVRVGLYARVSTTDQDCSQQLRDLRVFCEARGWSVEGEYVDHGVSGKKAKRPAMDKLMDAARQRRIDAVMVWKLDRWGRSVPHFVASVQELHTLGVRFVAVTQGIDTDESNPASKLLMNIMASFAEFERELIVERTLAGLTRARREGKTLGRPRKVLDRNKVRKLHRQGLGVRAIAAQLGVSHMTVHRIVKA
jgi:DNA invertase Pin-like site-specific DNA recombinase